MKKILLSFLISFCIILFNLPTNAQGFLMLAGGGGEDEGGWSDEPYQWVVDHAQNKRIAVISYSEQTNWLPEFR